MIFALQGTPWLLWARGVFAVQSLREGAVFFFAVVWKSGSLIVLRVNSGALRKPLAVWKGRFMAFLRVTELIEGKILENSIYTNQGRRHVNIPGVTTGQFLGWLLNAEVE